MKTFGILIALSLLAGCYGNGQYNPHWMSEFSYLDREYHPSSDEEPVIRAPVRSVCTVQMSNYCNNNPHNETCTKWFQSCGKN